MGGGENERIEKRTPFLPARRRSKKKYLGSIWRRRGKNDENCVSLPGRRVQFPMNCEQALGYIIGQRVSINAIPSHFWLE